MKKTMLINLAAFGAIFLMVGGCSKDTSTGALSCVASGTVVSGNASIANSTLTLNNVSVQIVNGATDGSFTVTLPSQQPVTVSGSSFSYPGALTVSAGSSVTVADTKNNQTGVCSLSGSATTTTSYGLQVTASPSANVAVGTTVTLTATDTSSTITPVFTFTTTTAQTGVSLTTLSSSTASLTSSVATTVTVTVTETSSALATSTATSQITITFAGGTTPTGAVQLAATPSTTANVGTPIYLTATAPSIPNAAFVFTQTYPATNIILPAVYNGTSATATVTSNQAGTVIISVAAYSTTSAVVATSQITLTFIGYTPPPPPTGTLNCVLSHSPNSSFIGNQVIFSIATDTGEAVQITQFYPGEPWSVTPYFPIYAPAGVRYSTPGYKYVQMYAESLSRPGVKCNGGNILTDLVYIYDFHFDY